MRFATSTFGASSAWVTRKYVGRTARGTGTRGVPAWRSGERVVAYLPNTVALRRITERCPNCFVEGGPLPPELRWSDWESAAAAFPSTGVYELYHEPRRTSQIGSGIVRPRLRQRIAATHHGRFNAADCVWWLYDLLLVGGRPSLRALPTDDAETPQDAETRWRELRRFDGWQVTSDV